MKINLRALKIVIPGAIPVAMFVKYYKWVMELPSNLFAIIAIIMGVITIRYLIQIAKHNRDIAIETKKINVLIEKREQA